MRHPGALVVSRRQTSETVEATTKRRRHCFGGFFHQIERVSRAGRHQTSSVRQVRHDDGKVNATMPNKRIVRSGPVLLDADGLVVERTVGPVRVGGWS
jgi:hypothetical protein